MAHLMPWLKKQLNKHFVSEYEKNVHFEIISEHGEQHPLTITVTRGPYRGVTYSYKNFKVEPDGRISYEIVGISGPSLTFTSEEKFSKIANEIYITCMEEALSNYRTLREEILTDEEDRTDYIEEPFEERTVRSKSNSVSKKRVRSRQKRKAIVPADSGVHSKVQPPTDRGSDIDLPQQS